MAFQFAAAEAPMPVRVARSLIWVQSAILILEGLFLVLLGAFFGDNSSVEIGPTTAHGGSAVAGGAVFIVAGVLFGALGVQIVKLSANIRIATVAAEIVYAVAGLTNGASPSTVVIVLGLALATVGLLFTPSASQGFAAGSASTATLSGSAAPLPPLDSPELDTPSGEAPVASDAESVPTKPEASASDAPGDSASE